MIVIDLFSGLGGWSQAFKDRGHTVFTVDFDPEFNSDLIMDLMDVHPNDLPACPDVILASPPCNRFSVMTISQCWDAIRSERHPRNIETVLAIGLVAKSIDLIRKLKPKYWVLENPVGMLRTALGPPAITTYFASWNPGGPKKPTDLWGKIPEMEWPKPKEWEKAPRGSDKGTQKNSWEKGKYDSAERAKIPYGLSLALCIAIERELIELGVS